MFHGLWNLIFCISIVEECKLQLMIGYFLKIHRKFACSSALVLYFSCCIFDLQKGTLHNFLNHAMEGKTSIFLWKQHFIRIVNAFCPFWTKMWKNFFWLTLRQVNFWFAYSQNQFIIISEYYNNYFSMTRKELKNRSSIWSV